MKRLFTLLLIVTFAVACSDNDTPNDDPRFALENTSISGGKLTGKPMLFDGGEMLTIDQTTQNLHSDSEVQFGFEKNGEALDLKIYEPHFSPDMPENLRIQIMIPSLSYTGHDHEISFSVKEIIPKAKFPNGWIDYPKYKITDLKGEILDTRCKITFTCAEKYVVSYGGRLLK